MRTADERSFVSIKFNSPQIFSGASNSSRIGCDKNISRDLRHRFRMSTSLSWTFFPGLAPRTAKLRREKHTIIRMKWFVSMHSMQPVCDWLDQENASTCSMSTDKHRLVAHSCSKCIFYLSVFFFLSFERNSTQTAHCHIEKLFSVHWRTMSADFCPIDFSKIDNFFLNWI